MVDTKGHQKTPAEAAEEKQEKDHAALIEGWTIGTAIAVAGFTGILVFVGIAGVCAAVRTLRAIESRAGVIERQTKAAETAAETALLNTKAFIHSQRPWISIQVRLQSQLLYDEQGAHIALEIALQNVGQMPATGVWIHPTIYMQNPTKPNVIEERKRICGDLTKRKPEFGQGVFPGQTIVQRYGIGASAGEIEESCRAILGDQAASARMFSPDIIVAVEYRTAIDKDACYYTAVIHHLSRREAVGDPIAYLALRIGETVPLQLLALHMTPVGGSVAE